MSYFEGWAAVGCSENLVVRGAGVNVQTKRENMNKAYAEKMVVQLLMNAARIRYGSVSVTAKVHEGRVVSVSYSTTEMTKEENTDIVL